MEDDIFFEVPEEYEDESGGEAGTAIVQRRRGPMNKAERAIKQRLFAKLMLDPDRHYSRAEIIERVGISDSTYDRWSRDPNLPDMAGIEPDRHNLKAKLLAAKLKVQAISELVDVMENDKNGLARVRAAEIILNYDTNLDVKPTDESEKEKVQQLLQINQPLFVLGNPDILNQIESQFQRQPSSSDDVIDGEVIEE